LSILDSWVEFERRWNLQIAHEIGIGCISIPLFIIVEFFSHFFLTQRSRFSQHDEASVPISNHRLIAGVILCLCKVLHFVFLLAHHAARIINNELCGLRLIFLLIFLVSCCLVILHIDILRLLIIVSLLISLISL
jgi:hypothetical protein